MNRISNKAVLKTSVATLLIGSALGAFAPAYAQDVAAKKDDVEEIIVTGSLIRNKNIESTSPVSVTTSEEIERRQINVAEDLLRDIPGSIPGIGSNVNNGNGGASTVNLRGLGTFRNLVLLDGERLVPGDTSGRVDLNNIPVALVSRVEILTGGASTSYGADAVSGVVNFITKRDFSGAEISLSNSLNGKGDGRKFRADVTLGANTSDGKGNLVLGLGYQQADPIYQGDRDFSRNQINSFSGVASGGSPTSIPVTFQLNDPDKFLQLRTSTGALEDAYQEFNFNPYNIFQTPFKRYNIYASGRYEISDRLEIYSRAMFSKNTVKTIIAPSGIFGEELNIPLNNPYLPGPTRLQLCADNGIAVASCNATSSVSVTVPEVYRRTPEVGSRTSTYSTQIFDYKAGLSFDISDKLKLDVSGAYGESENFETRTGYVRKSRVQQALNANNTTTCLDTSGGCIPLNIFGDVGSISTAQANFLAGSSSVLSKLALSQVRGLFTGELGAMSPFSEQGAGFAIGAEYRKYSGNVQPDSLAENPGELGGAGGATLPIRNAGYSVKEAYGELSLPVAQNLPLINSLTLEAGIRYSKYNVVADGNPSFGATTWKGALNWEPVENFKIRANYQRAVRAPTIFELFGPVTTSLDNFNSDPCAVSGAAGPAGNLLLRSVCVAQGAPLGSATAGTIQQPAAGQVNVTGGGNSNIKPEKANTYTIGFVMKSGLLIDGFSMSLDYYNITVNDAIASATPGDIIGACFNNLTAASATSAACTSIRRSTGGRLSGSTATVKGLPQPLTNLGRLKTNGVDLTADYKHEIGNVNLLLSFAGNWTRSSRFRSSPTALDRECVGFYSVNCAPNTGSIQPEFTWNQRTSIDFGGFELSLLWRHLSSIQFEPAATVTATGTTRLPFKGAITGTSPLAGTQVDFGKIGAANYFDLSARADVGEDITLNFGVDNLFNKKPPVVGNNIGSTAFNSGNTYPSTYDALGRSFSVSAKLRF